MIKKLFFIANKNLFRKKVNILVILLLVVTILLLVFGMSFSKTFKTFINNQVNGNIKNHILFVEKDDAIDISKINNVLFYYDYDNFIHNVKTDKGYNLELIGVSQSYLEEISKLKRINFSDKKILICPSTFYLGSEPENINDEFISNLHQGDKLIGSTINIQSINYDEKYKIIGNYNVNSYTYGEYNICFTLKENIKDIYEHEFLEYKQECQEQNANCDDIGNNLPKVIVVDDVKIINNTIKELKEKGLNPYKLLDIDTEDIDYIMYIFFAISIIVSFVSIIIMIISNKKFLQYNHKNNNILYSLGYSNKMITKINYLEYLIISLISFIISLIFITIIYIVLNKCFKSMVLTGCPIYISLLSIIISFMLVIIISLFSVYYSNMHSDSIVKEIKNDEI